MFDLMPVLFQGRAPILDQWFVLWPVRLFAVNALRLQGIMVFSGLGTREQRRRFPTGTRSQQRHVSCAHYFDAGCLYIFMSQLISREALYKKK